MNNIKALRSETELLLAGKMALVSRGATLRLRGGAIVTPRAARSSPQFRP